MIRKPPATPQMPAADYQAALNAFGFAQEGFAVALGYSGRAGQRWATGDAKVPGAVAVIIRLLEARPEMVQVLAQIAPMPEASRKARGRKAGVKVPPTAQSTTTKPKVKTKKAA